MNTQTKLHVDSLHYTINNKPILQGAFLSAQKGDIIHIQGRNGVGKSTLLNILFGTCKPNYIYIKINEKVLTNRSEYNRFFSFKPHFNIFPKYLKIKNILQLTDIENTPLNKKQELKIHHLSTGEQQFVQTLYVLNLPQPICLLDEPFSGISPILQELITNKIKEKAKSKIILLTDHHTDLTNAIATQIIELDNGYLKRI